MTVVSDLKLAEIDLTSGELAGDGYHQRLAEVAAAGGEYGWLASSPLAYIVLDRESAEFFLRSRSTAFPGREIADLFGVTFVPSAGHSGSTGAPASFGMAQQFDPSHAGTLLAFHS